MTTLRRFPLVALTGLLALLLLTGGSARAAFITRFEGQFSASDPGFPGRNTAISVDPDVYVEGRGEKGFFLSSGRVSSTEEPSAFVNSSISDLFIDIADFSDANPFGGIRNTDGTDILQVVGTGGIFANFMLAPVTEITSDLSAHTATLTTGVTLIDSISPGDDLSAFNSGGQLTIYLFNIDIVPTDDGQVFWQGSVDAVFVLGTPVPEPASVASLLTGVALLGLWTRRRRAKP